MIGLRRTAGSWLGWGLLLLAGFGVLACSDDDTDAGDVTGAVDQAGGAATELCDSLDELNTAVSDAGDLNADSTIDDAREAKDNVTRALDSVKDAAGVVVSALVTALETAVNAAASAIDNLSGEGTIGEAASGIASQLDSIGNSLEGLKSTANCG
jgi:hypothetical protein